MNSTSMNENMDVLVITGALYPNGNAEARRIHLFCKILKENSYKIFVCGNAKTGYLQIREYDKIFYTSLKTNSNNILMKYIGLKTYAIRLERYLNSIKKDNLPSVLLASDISNHAIHVLKRFCKKNNIQLVYDCVEWYSPSEFYYGKYSKGYREKNKQNSVVIDKTMKIISISDYFYTYFTEKGIQTERIPILCDFIVEPTQVRLSQNKIVFIYAGNPGNKDNLKILFDALLKMKDNSKEKFVFEFIGITNTFLKNHYKYSDKEIERLEKNCVFLGAMPHEEVIKHYKKANFSLLFRDETELYAKAGFPSKVVESLQYGVPVLCNYSSDLKKYLNSEFNAIVIESADSDSCVKGLEEINNLNIDALNQMKINSITTAQKYFYYKNFERIFLNLLFKK